MISTNYAEWTGPGEASWLLPRNSDRRLPHEEWGMWNENQSTLASIELGHRVKTGLIHENGWRHDGVSTSAANAIRTRINYPEQEGART